MTYQQEDYYDDTLTSEAETDTKYDQSTNNAATDPGNKQTGSSPVADTGKVQELIVPDQTAQQRTDQLDAKGCPAVQANSQRLSAPGWYYFDGVYWSSSKQRPDDVYAPSSDYCHVLRARDADDDKGTDNNDSSLESDSSESAHSDADLVQASTETRRHRHKRTRDKTVRRAVRPIYENHEFFNTDSTVAGKEPVENTVESIRAETEVSDQPPLRPPKSFQSQSWTEVKRNRGPPETAHSAAGGQENDVMATISSVGHVQRGRNTTRHFSEPAPNIEHGPEDVYYTREDYYSQIGKVSDQDYDVYSSDAQLKAEVVRLSGTHDWFYLYTERPKAEAILADSQSPDGTFAVISENIEVKPDFPFTLLLKCRGKVTETPIKRIVDFRKRRYELLNTRKDTILKLVEHFRQKPLSRFKITLKMNSVRSDKNAH